MIRLNAPRGLGDAIYLRAVVLHLLRKGESVAVFTRWPQVFNDLDVTIQPAADSVDHPDLISARPCFQCQLPQVRQLSQFDNLCLQAEITEPVELAIDWKVRNPSLLAKINRRANGPILVYQPLKRPGNSDDELRRPDGKAFRRLIERYGNYFKVKVGSSTFVESDADLPCDFDWFDKTSVTDAIDIVTIADLVVCEPSYLAALAQTFDKKFVCMFAARALRSKVRRAAGVTPQKIFHKPELATAVFDEE